MWVCLLIGGTVGYLFGELVVSNLGSPNRLVDKRIATTEILNVIADTAILVVDKETNHVVDIRADTSWDEVRKLMVDAWGDPVRIKYSSFSEYDEITVRSDNMAHVARRKHTTHTSADAFEEFGW